jgi:hypothetical protein
MTAYLVRYGVTGYVEVTVTAADPDAAYALAGPMAYAMVQDADAALVQLGHPVAIIDADLIDVEAVKP